MMKATTWCGSGQKNHLGENDGSLQTISGMLAEVDIITGKRR